MGWGLVQQQTFMCRIGIQSYGWVFGARLSDTLLGFETTGPRAGARWSAGAGSHRWVGVLVVALLWWWGVVFDLWIVVASI